MNGRYRAVSDGQWAKTNERYGDRPVVQAIWTVTTSCGDPTDCSGEVKSDQGWSAPIYSRAAFWYVKHVVPRWQKCPDGTSADGVQTFRFYPVDDAGMVDTFRDSVYSGQDYTVGPSGACGTNHVLDITMPLRVSKLD